MAADLRTAYRELVEIAGRLIQEARHHHAGPWKPLDGPPHTGTHGRPLPPALLSLLVELERATGPEAVARALDTSALKFTALEIGSDGSK